MPKRNIDRDMFEHKRERVATASANLDILADAKFSSLGGIVARAAVKYDVRPSWLLGVSPARATPDGCATWAANNLTKLVAEESELTRLTQTERRRLDTWLGELRGQCERFSLRHQIGETKRRRLRDAIQRFAAWAPK